MSRRTSTFILAVRRPRLLPCPLRQRSDAPFHFAFRPTAGSEKISKYAGRDVTKLFGPSPHGPTVRAQARACIRNGDGHTDPISRLIALTVYYHAWVNYDFLLSKCCIGVWVPD